MITANTIRDLFYAPRIFSVPPYQRAYAWEPEPHLKTLLADLKSQPHNRPYPYGTILLEEEPNHTNGFLKVNIVDGQQRLTTLVILMSVLLDKLEENANPQSCATRIKVARHNYLIDGVANVVKFRTIPSDLGFFESHIRSNNSIPISFDTPSQRRLWVAKMFFTKEFNNMTYEECLHILDTM